MAPRRDVFANFERMRREIDELFGDVHERAGFASRRGFQPRVDVYFADDPQRTVVEAELPGLELEQIGLEVRGHQLLIAGERPPPASEGRLYQQIEIEHGPFRRVVELGAEVDADRATATYDRGLLRVEIPLARPRTAVRRVPIKDGEEFDSAGGGAGE